MGGGIVEKDEWGESGENERKGVECEKADSVSDDSQIA